MLSVDPDDSLDRFVICPASGQIDAFTVSSFRNALHSGPRFPRAAPSRPERRATRGETGAADAAQAIESIWRSPL